ncbi:hypothetical protein BKA63DRAFT_554884 [Paraphoma chrysanthemicola]|nr:hypothetical protein BKA63DRAFT_554884 [Paraphoma chrysanthemicola]
MPVIKREESPEAPIASIAPSAPIATTTVNRNLSGLPATADDGQDVKPTMAGPAKPYIVAPHERLALTVYHGSSPRGYSLAASSPSSTSGGVVVPRAPPFAPLPSHLGSAVATAGRVNKTSSVKRMDPYFDGIGHGGDDGAGFPPMMLHDENNQMVTIPQADINNLRFQIQLLQNSNAVCEAKVQQQHAAIRELITMNQNTHNKLEDVNLRLLSVEAAFSMSDLVKLPLKQVVRAQRDFRAHYDDRSRSPSPSDGKYRERGSAKKGRKKLEISVPIMYEAPIAGLPTPQTSFIEAPKITRTPNTPITPGRIGPPSGVRKTNTCINKRGIHNLNEMVPPVYAQFPLVPITDSEIVIFFFNSLARPIVSLRLYARGWGPAAICDMLNAHRVIEPEYLRNTVSVKCTTAIKLGRRRYGDDWEEYHRGEFKDMKDDRATDRVHLSEDELPYAQDFDIRALCNGLRKFPGENDGGIFTDCVKWCQANNSAHTLSNVWELAVELDAGNTPKRIVPEQPAENPATTPKKKEQLEGSNDNEDAGSMTSEDSVIGNNTETAQQDSF